MLGVWVSGGLSGLVWVGFARKGGTGFKSLCRFFLAFGGSGGNHCEQLAAKPWVHEAVCKRRGTRMGLLGRKADTTL